MTATATELTLLDRWQRNFPLVEQPFAVIGQSAGLDEDTTIATFARLRDQELISRIGAVVKPNTVGASTLAAMRVAPDRVDEVAAIVNDEPLVNHNYEREHAINLWFVVTGPQPDTIAAAMQRIETRANLPVIRLPLIKAYHLDLGFSLTSPRERPSRARPAATYVADDSDRGILIAIEDGLPLVSRPFHRVGQKVGLHEEEVIERLQQLIAAGIVTRFGCVVRHRMLGYTSNAMAVWDIPNDIIDVVARHFVRNPHVTLCYRRPPRLPEWPYNLFCMVHARSRPEALAAIDDLNAIAQTGPYGQTTLFSLRCFKQRGAIFSDRQRGT